MKSNFGFIREQMNKQENTRNWEKENEPSEHRINDEINQSSRSFQLFNPDTYKNTEHRILVKEYLSSFIFSFLFVLFLNDLKNLNVKNKMYSTQLTDFHKVDVRNLLFQITERDNGVKRVRIMIEHPDGTRGDLILSTPRVLSFGLQEYKNDKKEVLGHQLPFILWGRKGPTPDETLFIEKLNEITDEIKHYLLHEIPDLNEENLERFSPLYYKIEKGEVVKDRAPLLFARLNVQRNHEDDSRTIRTLFTDETTKDRIDPMSILNKRCVVQGAVKVDSLIVTPGVRPRLQIKLFEARVRLLNNKNGFKSLLEPGKVYNKKTTK